MAWMDGNKDESERCIKIAQKYYSDGDKERAIKFLNKAERLYPTEKAKVLLEQYQSTSNGSAASGEDESGASGPMPNGEAHSDQSTTRQRKKSTHEPTAKPYSQDQLQQVTRIKKCKDYYEILGVSKDAEEDDLKKSYRKLALKLHPDKNHAPGATEAFKAVGNAFSVLNDPTKRRRYDQYGEESSQPSRRRRHSEYEYDYGRGFEGDISAEELFNMFFGGGAFSTGPVNRRYHHHRHQTSEENSYAFLLQLAPIFLLIVLSLLSSFLVGDPTYSLNRTKKYPHERVTSNMGISYYVKPDFNQDYQGSIRQLERQVENEYIENLRSNCFRERSYKENMLWRARAYHDADMYNRAQEITTPSCDKLTRLYEGA